MQEYRVVLKYVMKLYRVVLKFVMERVGFMVDVVALEQVSFFFLSTMVFL